ncbi:MAG: TetR family transcriptional regulator C-terminal domain-containing protein [Pseudomonadales bacterium]
MPKVVDHEQRRRDFVDAAYETILEKGLAGTTVRAVAKKAGYTTGALVHYFGDKDELIKQALTRFGDEVRANMESAQSEKSGRSALLQLMLEALPSNRGAGDRWRVWLAMWYRSESSQEMRREERARYREWLGRIEVVLEQSVDCGELPDTLNLTEEARTIVAMIDGIGVQYLMSNGRVPARTLTAMVNGYLERLYRR